jgi:glycosyltransferase involved in cell wall biosynthesis
MHRFVPASQVRTAPHASIDGAGAYPAATAQKVEPQARLKVAIIGALSKVKGADILEEVALLAARQNALVDFHLVGYAYRNLVHQPKARLTVHGSYEEADLPALLNWLQPNVLWFPAQCPETYSYTLSAALDSGCAIVAPNLGAFSERLRGRAWTWLCEWNSTPSEWLDFFSKIRTENFVTGIAPTQFQHKRATLDFKSLDYRSEYLADLPLPSQINFEQRHELRKLINLSAQNSHFLLGGRSKVKAFALRVLINLRASSLLSSAVKLVPASLQRRVKSWLIR